MARLIQDTIRKALADELLFGRLVNGGEVEIDIDNKEIIYKDYFNIGIAVDTENGLIVPVVKDVDKNYSHSNPGIDAKLKLV